MCGIALIVSGIRIDLSYLYPDRTSSTSVVETSDQVCVDVEDIKVVLRRRGPDSLGIKNVFLIPDVEGEESVIRVSDFVSESYSCGKLEFIGATLQLRGHTPITQPLVDTSGNILIYNGEIFDGVQVARDSNDAEILMEFLGKCCSCKSHKYAEECSCSKEGLLSVPELLSTIRGPWALIYWQENSKTIWLGKDAFGRRSLLVHWPSPRDSRLLLSSASSICETSDLRMQNETSELSFWEELPCGLYSLPIHTLNSDRHLVGEVRNHDWESSVIKELVKWERSSVEPIPEQPNITRTNHRNRQDTQLDFLAKTPVDIETMQESVSLPSLAAAVLTSLRKSVMRRTVLNNIYQAVPCEYAERSHAPVAVLFSGGLDSMILAAILDECLDTRYVIDLLNVSFDRESAPDRISAREGMKELHGIAPLRMCVSQSYSDYSKYPTKYLCRTELIKASSCRMWNLVEIDADLSKLTSETKHVMSLINPANTYMDLNIGIALWLAAGGNGWVNEVIGIDNDAVCQRIKYKSQARILLVGSGADEQCAGYGRHKTKYRQGSWVRLHEEMKLDMQRIWKRNLGRDDRCIADNGKEARFPFLDEDVIRTLLDIPLWQIADLDQPSGIGDKKILREVARLLGLQEAAVLPKRAIQFGSRIARESNRKNFGSNRAANQASAGSVVITSAKR